MLAKTNSTYKLTRYFGGKCVGVDKNKVLDMTALFKYLYRSEDVVKVDITITISLFT